MIALSHAKLQYEDYRGTPQTSTDCLRSSRERDERGSTQVDRGVHREGRETTKIEKITRMERDWKRRQPQPAPNHHILIGGCNG
jgi:hypothetical protein